MTWGLVAVAGGAVLGGVIQAEGAKDAASAQAKGSKEGQEMIKQAAEQARKDIIPLFNQAQRDAQAGYNASLDVIGEAVPAQIDAFTQGNMNAQETRIAGMDPFRQAIMGMPIDTSGIQPKGVNVDTSFLQRQSPVKAPPGEKAMQAGNLIDAFRRDPVGTQQYFDNIASFRQESIDSGIPLAEVIRKRAGEDESLGGFEQMLDDFSIKGPGETSPRERIDEAISGDKSVGKKLLGSIF